MNVAYNLEVPQDLNILRQNQVVQATPSLVSWITQEKLDWSLRCINKSSSTGLDSLSFSDLQNIRRQDLLNIINDIFAFAPTGLIRGRVTLITKIPKPVAQFYFRPICVMSVVVRLLHHIYTKRLDITTSTHPVSSLVGPLFRIFTSSRES